LAGWRSLVSETPTTATVWGLKSGVKFKTASTISPAEHLGVGAGEFAKTVVIADSYSDRYPWRPIAVSCSVTDIYLPHLL
jgi:hypothetical protein